MKKNIKFNNLTVGIKYAGSKLKLLPYILEIINNLKVKSVLDGFSGTTRVSQILAKQGYVVTSSDVSVWSEAFANCFLIAKESKSGFYQQKIDELNNLDGKLGWFSKQYGGDPKNPFSKKPFQLKNTMKLDAIRQKIDEYHLNFVDKSVLLTSLILALDKVDSTIGHYSSYLSKWSSRSFKDLKLKLPELNNYSVKHEVIKGDIFKVINNKCFDLAYLDPPYGSNNEKMPTSRIRYAAYYHFWTTVILNDQPKLFGKASRREDSRDMFTYSVFEDFRKNDQNEYIAIQAIEKLINDINAKYILFSYNNNGRASKNDLIKIFSKATEIKKIIEVDYKKNVMSTMKWTDEWTKDSKKNVEYLFLLEKPTKTA
ncbi:DNA adenine methylase [[Mycoplasma] testudinis]|uniref:DNA adenine methylase n=1 Tax=[Mycoplasma] testudinis TaxID=33924 RepID=UPI000489DCC3|nr:DNA adenine methylase [[Mycoplasma] testudinis]